MNQKKSPPTSTIQSIQRAAAILRSFTETEPELSVTELSQRLDLHKSTVSRILTTLQYEGLVGQNPENGKYRLGVGMVSLAGVALGRLDVRGLAQPHLNTLVEISQETINVTVLDGNECVNIERVASPKPIRYVGWIGRRTPLHCTASGKVLLAHMSPEERAGLLHFPLTKYTEKTIIEAARLEQSLAQVCIQGYAIVHEEFEDGFSAIAAPVFNHQGRVVATIAISGPTFRIDAETVASFVEPLLQTAQTISAEMGYTGPYQK
ncbi:MAG TPA: IclR family transcriptional regulator [Anaerolineae bacterium]